MRPIVSGTPYKHIFIMEDGRAMIGGTRIKVQYIAIASEQGETPEQICESYAPLTLGQVHSALAYYWDNKDLVKRQIREEEEYVEKMMRLNEPHQARLRKTAVEWRAKRQRRRLRARISAQPPI